MSDDRAERLRQNRNRAKQRAQSGEPSANDQSETSNPSQPSESSKQKTTKESESSGTREDSEENSTMKDDQIGTYMYLPKHQHQELSRQFHLLKAEYEYEYNEEFEKNPHFYPLAVKYGLDSLDSLDASEIQEKLDSLDS
ncbi:MAG: hypothetical protein J07HQX50_02316 [Haloquadratum sp. J07HQX50]|jgi:hypothetical protein|nr:MAG: hypothetical protein J07HQX50_02316 [Haloquadratum sp. J07HQX50]